MQRLLALVALLLFAPVPAMAQGAPSEIADSFFATLKSGGYSRAFSDIWGSSLMKTKPLEVSAVINQVGVAFQTYGTPEGHELVEEKVTSPSFRTNTYLVRAPMGPLFFRIQFYRFGSSWKVQRLDFADQLSRLP
jgi:hypothetical protein